MFPKQDNLRSKIIKTASIIFFLQIFAAIMLIAKNPIERYEICIYSSIPDIIWVLLPLAILGGIGIVVSQAAVSDENGKRYWWQIGLLIIVMSNLVVVLLPYLRGYLFAGTGDHLSHIGYTIDILQTGTKTSSNVYPITHIITSQLSSILGIPVYTMINFIGPLFFLSFILFTYLLSREILPKTASIFATLASNVLYCYYYNLVFPMGFAFITTVLFFYIYFRYCRYKSAEVMVILIITGILIVFFHPVTAFSLIIALLFMESGKLIFNRVCLSGRGDRSQVTQISLILPLLLFAALMLWIWEHFWVWNSSVKSVTGWFHKEMLVESMTDKSVEAFDLLGLDILGILELFVKMFGHYAIYAGLSLIAITAIAKRCLTSSNRNCREIFQYSIFFLPAMGIWITDYVRPLTTLSSGRIVCLVTALFPPLVGLALYKIGGMEREGDDSSLYLWRNLRMLSIILILIMCFSIGIFSLYPSPLTLRSNWAASYEMYSSQKWLLEKGDSSVAVLGLGHTATYRYAHALWGAKISGRKAYPVQNLDEKIPDHFNYHLGYAMFSDSLEGDRYLLSRENYVVQLYTELYTEIARYSKEDFSRLNMDPSVIKLYSNDGSQVYYIS